MKSQVEQLTFACAVKVLLAFAEVFFSIGVLSIGAFLLIGDPFLQGTKIGLSWTLKSFYNPQVKHLCSAIKGILYTLK